VVFPLMCVSWLKDSWTTLRARDILVAIVILGALEVAAGSAAVEAYRRYVERSRKILKGE
jgi:hypothetical protein